MPRFFFNLYDTTSDVDRSGIELPSRQAARQHGLRYLGAVLADAGAEPAGNADWRLEITDQRGLILYSVLICAINSAAIEPPAYRSASRR